MLTKSVWKQLGRFRNFQDNKRGMIFQSRVNENRIVRMVDQYGMAVALPIFIDQYGRETVAFHPRSIKALVEFLENK